MALYEIDKVTKIYLKSRSEWVNFETASSEEVKEVLQELYEIARENIDDGRYSYIPCRTIDWENCPYGFDGDPAEWDHFYDKKGE